jgi:hypothetical protein
MTQSGHLKWQLAAATVAQTLMTDAGSRGPVQKETHPITRASIKHYALWILKEPRPGLALAHRQIRRMIWRETGAVEGATPIEGES